MTAPPPPRSDLLQNAILFLNDPKVQTSTLTSKIEFLQSKGLNENEIQEAMRLAAAPSGMSSQAGPSASTSAVGGGGGYRGYEHDYAGPSSRMSNGVGMGRMEMAPVPPKRDWRDLFVSLYTFSWCHMLELEIYRYYH